MNSADRVYVAGVDGVLAGPLGFGRDGSVRVELDESYVVRFRLAGRSTYQNVTLASSHSSLIGGIHEPIRCPDPGGPGAPGRTLGRP